MQNWSLECASLCCRLQDMALLCYLGWLRTSNTASPYRVAGNTSKHDHHSACPLNFIKLLQDHKIGDSITDLILQMRN